MNTRVFDCHCDTALSWWRKGLPVADNGLQIDLNKTRQMQGYAQFFAVFTFPGMKSREGEPTMVFRGVLDNMKKVLREHSDRIAQARTPAEAEAIAASGKTACVFSMEGPAGIEFDPGRLEELYQEGFRMTTLTWNEQNPLAGSHVTGGGLTAQGKEFAKRAQSLGYMLDVSHLSEHAFWDLVNLAEKPIMASHSNSRKVWGHTRNLTDEQFKAIIQLDGVAGLNVYNSFLGEEPVTLDTACQHVLHFLELGGAKHIALGGDLDGCDRLPEGFHGPQDYEKLADRLKAYGVEDEVIEDIFWNNIARVFEKCCI